MKHTHAHYHNIIICIINAHAGDFHFMWECLKVIFLIFWGIPSQPGSLCNMREIIRRLQVDKTAKVFNTADEFVLHAFKAHLQAHICHLLGLKSPSDPIPHPKHSSGSVILQSELLCPH